MKLHVFVATTQGLVAIQNIIDIDDVEISSIVSVNGTSTTANISSAYHGFVKKGAGIIEQDFGGSSYRVNLSERIDHGNSWQLAFYLAHIAHEQDLLGDGEVQPADQIICATGEINTTKREVLAVGQVRLKQALAKEQIQQWLQMAVKLTFLLPEANRQDVDPAWPIQPQLISTIDDAVRCMPVLAASKPLTAQSAASSEPQLPFRARLMTRLAKISDQNLSLKFKLLLGLLFIVLLSGLFQLNIAPTVKPPSGPLDVLSAAATTSVARVISPLDTDQIEITATLAIYGDCSDELSQQQVKNNGPVFVTTKLVNLCQLMLAAPPEVTTVILVAADTHAIVLLERDQNSWQIPLPEIQVVDRHYFLVLLPRANTELERPDYRHLLQHYLQREIKSPLLKVNHLQQWLNKNNWPGTIISHSLDTF